MRTNLPLRILLIGLACVTLAQGTLVAKPKPFRIRGHFENAPAGSMMFFFRDASSGYKVVTIEDVTLDKKGNFFLETFAVTGPVRATLRSDSLSFDIYAAPGFDLFVTGDLRELVSFQRTKSVSGVGAQANRYLFKSDSMAWSATGSPWYDMNLVELVKWAEKKEHQLKQFHASIFGGQSKDAFLPAFEKMATVDRKSMSLYYLLYGIVMDSTLNPSQSEKFLKANADPEFYPRIYDNQNLISADYQGWLMGTYAIYLRTLAIRKKEIYGDDKNADFQLLDQVLNNYKNQIRDLRLYVKMDQMIEVSGSLEGLNELSTKLSTYINALQLPHDRQRLLEKIKNTERELAKNTAGRPTPTVSVSDSTGTVHHLEELKGKVIYIDLWASWCGPCKAEQPHYKSIIDLFANEENIAFVGIAVMDKHRNWMKSLKKDKPAGLQWYDVNGEVVNNYHVSAIPRFILIGKNGELISDDAPKPSDRDELLILLNQALAK